MTRRKRSPSPSASSKRVAFEIPASLQQFSSISRSLATHVQSSQHTPPCPSTASPYGHTRTQSGAPSQTFQRSLQQTFSRHSSLAQSPSRAIDREPRSRPASQPLSPGSGAAKTVQAEGSRQTVGVPAKGHSSSLRPPWPGAVLSHTRTTSNPISSSARTLIEPALRPGETPILNTHPGLIASLIAKKRAENEAGGHRVRWQQQQAEYQAGKSPGSQLINELEAEANLYAPKPPQNRSVSNPLPVRTSPIPSRPNPQPQSLIESSPGATNPQSTPATEGSIHDTDTSGESQVSQGDPDAGSPFSSPIAEFLEQATDAAGLENGSPEHNSAENDPSEADHVAEGSHGSVYDQGAPAQAEEQENLQWYLQDAVVRATNQPLIPPVFSANPSPQETPQQPFQAQYNSNSVTFAHQQVHPIRFPSYPSNYLQPRNSMSASRVLVQFPAQPQQINYGWMDASFPRGQSAFYKTRLRKQYATGSSHNSFPMSLPVNGGWQAGAPQVVPNVPGFQPIMPQPPQPVGALGNLNIAIPYPPPGPVPTYGNSIMSGQLGNTSVGFMTAADMVANAHTRSTIPTEARLSLPRRC